MNKRFLKKAVKIAGSKGALAKSIGVHPTLIGKWLQEMPKGGIKPKLIIAIEHATDGQVTRHDLCPDIWPVAAE